MSKALLVSTLLGLGAPGHRRKPLRASGQSKVLTQFFTTLPSSDACAYLGVEVGWGLLQGVHGLGGQRKKQGGF